MMNTMETIECFIDEHVDDLVEDVAKLIRIDSTKGEAVPGAPFGEGPRKALDEACELLAGYGFEPRVVEDAVTVADMSSCEPGLDILAHLDVVPVSDSWTVTEPFSPKVVDGRIYGRGSIDDKGPAVASIYAMRAVREAGVGLKRNVRLILGSDEECGSGDIERYYAVEQPAPMTLSPDAQFPLVNIEKGILHGEFRGNWQGCVAGGRGLRSLKAGHAINAVPGEAWAVLEGYAQGGLSGPCERAARQTGASFTLEPVGCESSAWRIVVRGCACHASTPAEGTNALTALLSLLAAPELGDYVGRDMVVGLAALFPHGRWDGEALGIAMSDELSGGVEISLTKLSLADGTACGGFDCRAPLCATNENLRDVAAAKLAELGLTLGPRPIYAPHHVSEESDFVQTLLGCYEAYTGVRARPLCIGGGTYVHSIENGVAFGCEDPSVDYHMHGDDEFVDISQLVLSAKVYARAIVELCA